MKKKSKFDQNYAKYVEYYKKFKNNNYMTPMLSKSEYRSKLKAKVEQLLDNTTVDESVLATEIIVYADKMCVDEEMVRLRWGQASI